MAIQSATFKIEVERGQPVVTRELAFTNGDNISFSVGLQPNAIDSSIAEAHRLSIQRAIDQLQALLESK